VKQLRPVGGFRKVCTCRVRKGPSPYDCGGPRHYLRWREVTPLNMEDPHSVAGKINSVFEVHKMHRIMIAKIYFN
jgi:hypothetical protein